MSPAPLHTASFRSARISICPSTDAGTTDSQPFGIGLVCFPNSTRTSWAVTVSVGSRTARLSLTAFLRFSNRINPRTPLENERKIFPLPPPKQMLAPRGDITPPGFHDQLALRLLNRR